MDPFVRRLIERLHDPSRPLTRNRHFHTFETPEGKLALRTSRRLKSLQRDILACASEGGRAKLTKASRTEEDVRVELSLDSISGKRTSILREDELELLVQLPGVRDALAR